MAVRHRYMSVGMWKIYGSDKSPLVFVRNQNLFFEKMVFEQESLCYSEGELHRI